MMATSDLDHFYTLMKRLEVECGGCRKLCECNSRTGWPERGVYFFFEPGEYRADGKTPRVVRIGTHAVSTGSKAKLWQRLKNHQGSRHGGGSHRGSIFRLHVGMAMIEKNGWQALYPHWDDCDSASSEIREAERELERLVSMHIGQMPFLWLKVDDSSAKDSLRANLERNSIGLLSTEGLSDRPSSKWLGRWSIKPEVRESGLWNVKHVGAIHDPEFLAVLEGKMKE